MPAPPHLPPVHRPHPVEARGVCLLLELLRDKWRAPVLLVLLDGTSRYSNLNRRLPEVSRTMLTRTLRELECRGLVERRMFACVPLKVEYTLTPLGHILAAQVESLNKWALEHEKDLLFMVVHPGRQPD